MRAFEVVRLSVVVPLDADVDTSLRRPSLAQPVHHGLLDVIR